MSQLGCQMQLSASSSGASLDSRTKNVMKVSKQIPSIHNDGLIRTDIIIVEKVARELQETENSEMTIFGDDLREVRA
jgi:hypothetical protein